MGWILVFLSGCVLAFLFFILFFRFGLFNGTVLTEAFEESGYYKAEEAAMEERFSECLEEAELPEGILRFADYRDAFQRSLRNEVYGRGGTVPELTALSIAEELTAKLNSMGLEERSLPAEEGILLLSGRLEEGFLETGTVTGAAEWYEAEGRLEPLELWAVGFLILLFLGQSLLWMLQRRKKRYARLLAFSLIWGSALYGLLLGFLFWALPTITEGSGIAVGSETVTALYREKTPGRSFSVISASCSAPLSLPARPAAPSCVFTKLYSMPAVTSNRSKASPAGGTVSPAEQVSRPSAAKQSRSRS